MPRLSGLFAGLAVACFALLLFAAPGRAQDQDCQKGCQKLMEEGTVTNDEEMERCLANCAKLKDMGVEGFSIKCAYTLPKVCGAELGWDLLRHCFTPCIEFKKDKCGSCLGKYGFCGKHSLCREWVCKCLMKDSTDCESTFNKACKK